MTINQHLWTSGEIFEFNWVIPPIEYCDKFEMLLPVGFWQNIKEIAAAKIQIVRAERT